MEKDHQLPEEIPTYNERQLEELGKFEHVLGTLAAYEGTNGEYQLSGTYEEKGKKKEYVIFSIDQRLMGVIDRTGFNMYRGFVEESDEMKIAAQGILDVHSRAREDTRQQELDLLNEIWEASK